MQIKIKNAEEKFTSIVDVQNKYKKPVGRLAVLLAIVAIILFGLSFVLHHGIGITCSNLSCVAGGGSALATLSYCFIRRSEANEKKELEEGEIKLEELRQEQINKVFNSGTQKVICDGSEYKQYCETLATFEKGGKTYKIAVLQIAKGHKSIVSMLNLKQISSTEHQLRIYN